jgi:SAM-dependent methyltransferase
MTEDLARSTYDAFAPIYNEFNHLNDYEMWLGEVLLPELEKHGLKRGRALDVGCGTGRAFGLPLRRIRFHTSNRRLMVQEPHSIGELNQWQ